MSIANIAKKNILETIGNTPIVSLNNLAPDLNVKLYGKCEFMNPGGSIKDRIAVHLVNMAEERGELKPGGTIVEATSGNTGVGLAMVAALRGYKCIFVMADKQSEEKRRALKAMGAQVVICPTDVPAEDDRSYYQVAKRIASDIPNCFYANQYNNTDNTDAHYLSTGPEIYEQCGQSLDYLVVGLGTGGSVTGTSRYLKERIPHLKTIGADPIGSLYYEYFYTGRVGTAHTYLVEGIGEDFFPLAMDLKSVDDIVQVDDKESFLTARQLVRKLGVLAGGSSGSAVLGAIKFFRANPKIEGKNVLVLLPDSSSRYVSKHLNDDWFYEKFKE